MSNKLGENIILFYYRKKAKIIMEIIN